MNDEVKNVDVEPMPQPSTSAAPTTKRRKTQKTQSSWHVNDDCDLNFPGRDAEGSPSGASTPLKFVEMFWPAKIFEILARETNIRHMAKTGRKLNCSATEMQKFLGISLLMGCIRYPRIKMYRRQGFCISLISDNMSRNRYLLLRSFLRAMAGIDMPEEEKKADRLWRVRPIMESFRQCCLKVSRAPELSGDKMMIPFQGKMPLRQYLSLKPNPFGMKVFVLPNPNGVILDFHAYTGEGTFRHLAQQVTGMGIGASAVITLLNNVPVGSSLYFDRYFTSEALLDYLLEHSISGTGTVIKSRLPRGITFKENSAINKEGRGTFQIFERDDQKMCATKWLDNKPVFLLYTAHAATPVDTVKSWSKKDRDHVDVRRPSVVRLYNHCIGGVDLAGRMAFLYRMKARTNK